MSRFISRQEAIEQGAVRYFTGQPCKREHVAERWTIGGGCVACEEEKRRSLRERVLAARHANQEGERG